MVTPSWPAVGVTIPVLVMFIPTGNADDDGAYERATASHAHARNDGR